MKIPVDLEDQIPMSTAILSSISRAVELLNLAHG